MDGSGRTTVVRRVAEHAKRSPDRPALCLYEGEVFGVWSYADLQARVLRWAERLTEAGGREGGERTAFIVLPHGIDLYAAFLGAMAAGLVPSMLPTPQVRQDRALWADAQAAVIRRARPVAIVAGPAEREALGEVVAQLPVLGPERFRPAAPGFRPRDPRPEAPALLQHSSGTTGLKKGVVLTYAQVDKHLDMVAQRLGAGPTDVFASWLPLYHDMGLVAAFLLPLSLGAGVVALDPFGWVSDPMSLLRAISRHRATLAWMPNFAFAHMVRTRGGHPAVDVSSLRALVDCSEPCRPSTLDRFAEAFADCGITPDKLACCYGMAEVVFAVTQTPPGRGPRTLKLDAEALDGPRRRVTPAAPGGRTRALLSCGAPLAGIQLRIDGPAGSAGEILVRSPTRMSGYHGGGPDPGALAGGWRRSGDMGLIDGGELFVCGRIKEMLIVHGRNLYAGDVEACVSAVPGVKPGRAVALGLYDEETGTEELALMVETEGDPDTTALQAVVREAVRGAFAVSPRHVAVADRGALAKSTAGKMSRADNLQRLKALLHASSMRKEPAMGVGAQGLELQAPAESAPSMSSPHPQRAGGELALVARALHECFGADAAQVEAATAPEHVAGWDSLGHTVLLLRLETLAAVRLGEAAAEARTAGELAALIAALRYIASERLAA